MQGKLKPESRSVPGSAVDSNSALVSVDDKLGNGQPETGAAGALAVLALSKLPKQSGAHFFIDSRTIVYHRNVQTVGFALALDCNCSTGRRKFDGIG